VIASLVIYQISSHSQWDDHMKTSILPYMMKTPDLPNAASSTALPPSYETPIGKELLEMLRGKMVNLRSSTDRLAGFIGPVEDITNAVTSSQALIDRLNVNGL